MANNRKGSNRNRRAQPNGYKSAESGKTKITVKVSPSGADDFQGRSRRDQVDENELVESGNESTQPQDTHPAASCRSLVRDATNEGVPSYQPRHGNQVEHEIDQTKISLSKETDDGHRPPQSHEADGVSVDDHRCRPGNGFKRDHDPAAGGKNQYDQLEYNSQSHGDQSNHTRTVDPQYKYRHAIPSDSRQPVHDAHDTSSASSYSLQEQYHRQLQVNAMLQENLYQLQGVQSNWEYYLKKMDELQFDLNALRNEALSRTDRYQPVFDESIISQFSGVNSKMKPFLTLLTRQNFDHPIELVDLNGNLMWNACRDWQSIKIDLKDRYFRKRMLQGILWRFLERNLFRHPFQAFQPEASDSIYSAYSSLWKDPMMDEDAVKWRTISVSKLVPAEADRDGCLASTRMMLLDAFDIVLHQLGLPKIIDIKDGEKKLVPMLDVAIDLAQTLATQRANYQLWEPHDRSKNEDDEMLTNTDDAYEDEIERPGIVQFVIRPALVKWGTGKGQNLSEKTVLIKAIVALD